MSRPKNRSMLPNNSSNRFFWGITKPKFGELPRAGSQMSRSGRKSWSAVRDALADQDLNICWHLDVKAIPTRYGPTASQTLTGWRVSLSADVGTGSEKAGERIRYIGMISTSTDRVALYVQPGLATW